MPTPVNPPNNLPTEDDNANEPVKEFLKRDEIKTLEKDVVILREKEVLQERARISSIKPGVPLAAPIAKTLTPDVSPSTSGVDTTAAPKAELVIPPMPVIPSASSVGKILFPRKIIFRAVLVIAGLALVGFLAFTFWSRNKPAETINPTPTPPATITTSPAPSAQPENPLPQTIIPIPGAKIIQNADLTAFFPIALPNEILPLLEENYTLAVLNQKEGDRQILVAKIKDKTGLIGLLKTWEITAAKATSSLAKTFKNATFQGTPFRYFSLAKNDYGICYLITGDYFAVTTSGASMQKIIPLISLEKKLGQMFIVGFNGTSTSLELTSFFKKYKPGGVLLQAKNIENPEQTKALTSQLQALSKKETGLPLFIAISQEDNQKELTSQDQAQLIGLQRGQELKYLGINLNLAPLLDWATAGDFLFDRSFQKPTTTSATMAQAIITGQKAAGILTAVKYFPGYSGIAFNPEEKLAELDKTPEFSQFKEALASVPELIMTANAIYKDIDPSLPFAFSPLAIQFLKSALGSASLVLTDDLSQNSLLQKFTPKYIATQPIIAGTDLLLFSGYQSSVSQSLDEFLKSYNAGEISQEKVQNAVNRIIKLKQALIK